MIEVDLRVAAYELVRAKLDAACPARTWATWPCAWRTRRRPSETPIRCA